jgi:hypothetical protein
MKNIYWAFRGSDATTLTTTFHDASLHPDEEEIAANHIQSYSDAAVVTEKFDCPFQEEQAESRRVPSA